MLEDKEKAPQKIPYPIVFVHKGLHKWTDLKAEEALTDLSKLSERLRSGRDVWIITTYLMLKGRGHNVRLSQHFVPDTVCITHYDDINPRSYPFCSYIVSIRADRDRTFICDSEIVQSPSSVEGGNAYYVSHWPQPGLTPRNPNRGDTISVLAYFGMEKNLGARFKDEAFERQLRDIGVRLVVEEEKWNDYSEVDVVLAVRDGSPYFLASKPASKLINAWLAGCPSILGPEPAYESLHKSDLDYFVASDTKEVIDIIKQLKNEPSLFTRMVDNGKERAREYTYEEIASEWEKILGNPIRVDYEKWRTKPTLVRRGEAMCKYSYRVLRRKMRGKKYVRGYDEKGEPIERRLAHKVFGRKT